MEGGAIGERTLRRLPFALAAACLATGALGLAFTLHERTLLVPYQPVGYADAVREPDTKRKGGEAPGSLLDGLTPESQFVAEVAETPAVVAPAPAPARVSAAAAPSGGLAVVPAVPATPPEDTGGAVLDSEPPAVPRAADASAPAPAPASNSRPPVSVLSVETGTSLPSYGSRSPDTNQDRPSATDNKPAPTATPTQAPPPPANTPAATPTKTPPGKAKK